MIRIAIIEDEPEQQEAIKALLETWCEKNGIEYLADCYSDGINIAEDYGGQYDIAFCDIQMKLLDGMKTAELLREKDPALIIIFVTNLAEYAIRGYEVGALGYLLKPIKYASFSMYMDRAARSIAERQNSDYLVVEGGGSAVRVPLAEIHYMEYSNHYITIVTAECSRQIYMSAGDMEKLLEGRNIVRCNRGCFVNLKFVEGIYGNDVCVKGRMIPISRSRKKEFTEAVVSYLGKHV